MRDTLRQLVRTLVFTGLFWSLLCVGKAASEKPSHKDEVANIVLERQTRECAHCPKIPAVIVNKARIEGEAQAPLVGLREIGNPHIRGGLRPSEIQDRPALSRVERLEAVKPNQRSRGDRWMGKKAGNSRQTPRAKHDLLIRKMSAKVRAVADE